MATTQADLDAWHAENYATRRAAQPFLRWCMDTRRMPRLTIPYRATTNPQPMGRHQRLTALRRVLDNDAAPLRSRAAAALVLLFAQPLTRIVCLTTDDILDDGQQVHLRLGAPPSPLPEPVADLVRDYLRSLPAHTPAVNLSAHWLFPGRRPGQPVNTSTLRDALRDLGFPNQRARTSAIRHLVLQAPAPVIAKALGYHDKTATRLVTEAGGTWSRYAPGDHTR